MNSSPTAQEPTPAERLAKLKEVVRHLADMWMVVLQRLTYLQMLTSSDELWTALNQTRAAHVHNAIQDVLLGDLILQLAALILDKDSGSASVSRPGGHLELLHPWPGQTPPLDSGGRAG
jgi:hypothetical protein